MEDTDYEDEGSTDVYNHYRNVRWTDKTPRHADTEADTEAEQE